MGIGAVDDAVATFSDSKATISDKVQATINVGLALPGKGGGKMSNKLEPYKLAMPNESTAGAHSSFRTNAEGKVTNYAEYKPNAKNPTGFDEVKRVDLTGDSHKNKTTGEDVKTPHVHGKDIQGGVRPAEKQELPAWMPKGMDNNKLINKN